MNYRSKGPSKNNVYTLGVALVLATVLAIAVCQAAPRPLVAQLHDTNHRAHQVHRENILGEFGVLGGGRHAVAPAAAQSPVLNLQQALDRILSVPAIERASWGVLVRSLKTDETIYAVNPGKLMMPASTLKVVTLAAAGERLGWDYAYETRLVADGTVDRDTLNGNLVIVASGDPSLNRPTLDAWAAQIRMLGIATVTGTVLADARAFAGERLGAGWSWDDLAYYYAAPIAAAQYRENAVDLTVRPGATVGSPAIYELNPPDVSGVRVENRMTTGASIAAPEFVARRAANSSLVVIEGVVPAGSRPAVRPLSVHDPVRYLAAAFSEALAAAGVAVGAPPPADANADASRDYSGATVLLTHHSEPLSMLARRFMEDSQNQYGETLLKTMGAQAGTPTFDGGVKAVETVLEAWGVPAEGAALRDGSGLSRYNYLAPETLVQVLTRMFRDPAQSDSFLTALALVGRTGTVAGRMRNTPAAGRVRAKDGSMTGVRALCGVVTTADGEPLVFAILANSFAVPGPTVNAAIDALVVQLASFRR